ncbi:MAG: hypothetical protein AAB654_03240, partial [Acidobacteriota bacterium]
LEPPGRSGGLRTYLSQAITYHDLNRKQAYSQRWTLELQRLLPSHFVIDTSYVGNRGTRLGVNRQLNSVPRQYLTTSALRDATTIGFLGDVFNNPFYGLGPFYTRTITRGNLLKPYPHFGNITNSQPMGYNWYHALQVRAGRRMTRGFTANLGYAFTKTMEATQFLNETDPMPYETISAGHRPHRLTVNGILEIPVGRGKRLFPNLPRRLNRVFGNWQLSAVVIRQAGAPLTWGNIPFAGDVKDIALPKSERDVDRWFNTDAGFFRTTNLGSLASNIRSFPLRFAGITADGQSKWDVSVTKAFRITERYQVRFRAQCFNLMNHANFGTPNLTPDQHRLRADHGHRRPAANLPVLPEHAVLTPEMGTVTNVPFSAAAGKGVICYCP